MNSLFSEEDSKTLFDLRLQAYLIMERSLVRNNKNIWLSNKEDKHNIFLAGGWFASKLQKQTPKDIDIFILCGPTSAIFSRYYSALLDGAYERKKEAKSHTLVQSGLHYDHNDKIWSVFTDDNVPKIQYIFSKHSTRKALIKEFDFAHTMISYSLGEQKLYTTYKSYDAAKNKKLIDNHNPKEWRRIKFRERGYIEEAECFTQEYESAPPSMNSPPWHPQNPRVSGPPIQSKSYDYTKYHEKLIEAIEQQKNTLKYLE